MLDRYILGKTRALVESLAGRLDVYDIAAACQLLRDYLELLDPESARSYSDAYAPAMAATP